MCRAPPLRTRARHGATAAAAGGPHRRTGATGAQADQLLHGAPLDLLLANLTMDPRTIIVPSRGEEMLATGLA